MKQFGSRSVRCFDLSVVDHILITTGNLSENMNDHDGALGAYEQALRHNPRSTVALNAMSVIMRNKDQFPKAIEYLNAILQYDQQNGDVWGSMGKRLPSYHHWHTC